MGDDSKDYKSCYEKQLDLFTTYDQTVDVVSCWQAIFNYGYKNHFEYLDRFPNMQPGNYTPDFTILFNEKYGIIFEIKRTFPNDNDGFKRKVEQLMSYDKSLEFKKNDSGDSIVPEVHDIVLLVGSSSSYEILRRINSLIDQDDDINFNNNIIILEYQFNSLDRVSHYLFRKLPGNNGKFRDHHLPKEERLEYILGEQAKSLKSMPEHFFPYKINYVLCNDEPPEIYLSVFLWGHIFYYYLRDDQKLEWQRGNIQKIQSIEIDIDDLLSDINDNYLLHCSLRRGSLRRALKYLEIAGMARMIDDNNVEVRFRNLTYFLGHRKYSYVGEKEQDNIQEIRNNIADKYCNNISGKIGTDVDGIGVKEKPTQTKLFNKWVKSEK